MPIPIRLTALSRTAAMAGLVCALLIAPQMAQADAVCDTVMSNLTSPRADGQGTPELEHKARLGDCFAAAKLVRRGKDAAGYAKLHCPLQVQDRAASVLAVGQEMLDTPDCQG